MDSGQRMIQARHEVQTFLDRLCYALQDGGARINLVRMRRVDQRRDRRFTNEYTIAQLFPNEDPVQALKRELPSLTVADYIETVKDRRFPKRPNLLVFGKTYHEGDVYVKVRIELMISGSGWWEITILSFISLKPRLPILTFLIEGRGELFDRDRK